MKRIFLTILILGAFVFPAQASKVRDVREGNKLYAQGKYNEAMEKYTDALKKDANSDIVNFNLGASLYKKEDYAGALTHYQRALLGHDQKIKENVHYNLGNTLYRSGIKKENSDLKSAIASLEKALEEYKEDLSVTPEDPDTKQNQAFVGKELERLKKKLQEQQKNQQSKEPQQQQDQQKDQQSGDQKQNEQPKDKEEKKGGQLGQFNEEKEKQEPSTAQEQNQEDLEKNKQGSQQQNQQNQQDQPPRHGSSYKADAKELSEEEAKKLLENYSQNEEPRGLLILTPQKPKTTEVEKDW